MIVRSPNPTQLSVASCRMPGGKKFEQISKATMLIRFKFIMTGMSLWQNPTASKGMPTTCNKKRKVAT